MIPLGDEHPTLRTPVMTYAILAALVGTWVFVQGAGFNERQLAASICNLGMVPGEITHLARLGTGVPLGDGMACIIDNEPINSLSPLISMFLHGGWLHLLGNCLFFWVFGNNIEDSMGHFRFLVFYLVCGLAAAAAYLVLYPRVRVRMLFIFIVFFKVISIPAWAVLLWWFGWQVISALPEVMSVRPEVSSGVAVWAHIGGFITGVVLVKLFENPNLVARRSVPA